MPEGLCFAYALIKEAPTAWYRDLAFNRRYELENEATAKVRESTLDGTKGKGGAGA
jgi:hypothetical protein